jgi:hypothetical protein
MAMRRSLWLLLWLIVESSASAQTINRQNFWTECSISVPAMAEGKQVVFGFLLSGTGKGWVDDLQLLVDGQPEAQASRRDYSGFEFGSGVGLSSLSDSQVQNPATLGKVWGFLKYHHPAIVSGKRQWDYDLISILPRVLDAADSAAQHA